MYGMYADNHTLLKDSKIRIGSSPDNQKTKPKHAPPPDSGHAPYYHLTATRMRK